MWRLVILTEAKLYDKIVRGDSMDKDESRKELYALNGEEIYWDLLKDPSTSDNLKASIIKSHPDFKNRMLKITPNTGPCECKCQKKQKRKEKYKDILEYIEMYVKWALMSKEPNITISEIKPLYDKVQEWLEEEV